MKDFPITELEDFGAIGKLEESTFLVSKLFEVVPIFQSEYMKTSHYGHQTFSNLINFRIILFTKSDGRFPELVFDELSVLTCESLLGC